MHAVWIRAVVVGDVGVGDALAKVCLFYDVFAWCEWCAGRNGKKYLEAVDAEVEE